MSVPDNEMKTDTGRRTLEIIEPEHRETGPILICDADHNDIAEFFHSEHATVGQSYETALRHAQALVAAPAPVDAGARPIVKIKPMTLSGNRTDYFVSIQCGDREVTPHVFREEYKAAYHVALYDWLLNGSGEEPDCVEFGPDDWPALSSQPVFDREKDALVREALTRASKVKLGEPDTVCYTAVGLAEKYHSVDQIIEFASARVQAALTPAAPEGDGIQKRLNSESDHQTEQPPPVLSKALLTLRAARNAIAKAPEDTWGMSGDEDGYGGFRCWPIQHELLSNLDEAIAQLSDDASVQSDESLRGASLSEPLYAREAADILIGSIDLAIGFIDPKRGPSRLNARQMADKLASAKTVALSLIRRGE